MVLAAATMAYRNIMRILEHRRTRYGGHSAAALAAVAICAVALAGCSAQKSPFRGVAKAVNFATDTPPPADFVGAARTPTSGYMKVPRDLPARPTQPRKADDVKALEQSLEATRSRNAAAGAAVQAEGKTPPPTPAVAPPTPPGAPPTAPAE